MSASLASSYAIRIYPSNNIEGECNELKWALHSLSHWEQSNQGEGTLALRALSDCAQLDGRADAVCTLTCEWTQSDLADPSLVHSNADACCWSINVAAVEEDEIVPRELVCVLSRIMVQSVATSQIASKVREKETLLRITLPLLEGEGCQQMLLSDLFPTDERGLPNNSGVRHLFTPLNSQHANMEIVDMVNQQGRVLGSLPRPYIHTWNILHRGIGMIVSKDVDIFKAFKSGKTPDVYVHQRTSTKRIFPSLFDMFVGGVSSSGEDAQWTAAREVAEELGLKRALDALENKQEDQIINPLSEELFQCTVCTSYNRCVVSMFTYTCDTALESITWQEEEVAWGDYVPYDIVTLAGEMSIDRLVEKGVWPGSGCHNEESVNDANDAQQESTIEELKNKYGNNNQPWDTWDFVPDGLLVWEAWESFLRREGYNR